MRPSHLPHHRTAGRRSADTDDFGIREDERAYIARELHDDLGQLLAALRLDLHLMQLNPSPEILADMDHLLLSAITSLRRISAGLRPLALTEGGLHFALQTLCSDFEHRHGIACVLAMRQADLGLNDRYSTAVYRLVQESLTNIGRHAGAGRVSLRIGHAGDALEIVIQDDGCGIGVADLRKAGAFGLLGMRERVAALGGELAIGAARPGVQAGGGTRITILLPRPGAAHGQ